MLCGMSIASEYAITRPASNALFLTTFSSSFYPWVWLFTVPLNLFVIYLYNRFLPKIGPFKMLASIASISIAINTSFAFLLPKIPQLIFFHYAWKDIYILLMFKQLWSMIHSTIPSGRAKYLYGMIFGMGTLGSILASALPGFLAVKIGSERLFLFTLPIYLFLIFFYWMAFRRSGVKETSFQQELPESSKEGFSLILRSPFLLSILGLVIFMQISVGLVEYLFNAHLELNILDKDLRTEYCGRIIGLTNIASAVFQFLGALVLIHFAGLKKGHFLIPFFLCISGILSFTFPTFAIATASFIFVKSVDFSLFGVFREMLYIPLKLDEKFRAKAIIDVFAYRTSKGLVSLFILILQASAGLALLSYISLLSIIIFVAWMALVLIMFKKYAPDLQETA